MFRALIGVIIFILFYFPTMLGALYTFGVLNWAFDRELYINVLDDPRLYDALLDEEFSAEIARAMLSDESVDVASVQTTQAITQAVQVSIDTEYLRTQIVGAVDAIFAWFDGKTSTLDISLDLTPFKAAVNGEQRGEIAAILARELPSCNDIPDAQTTTAAGNTLYTCIPSDMSRDEAESVIYDQLPTYVQDLPDSLSLSDLPGNVESWQASIPAGSIRGLINASLIAFAATALLMWFVMSLIAGKGLRGFLLWMGITLIIPGALVLLTGLPISAGALRVEALGLQPGDINIAGQPASADVSQTLSDAIAEILRRVGEGWSMVGGLAVGIGAALTAIGIFVTRRPDDPEKLKVGVPAGELAKARRE
jgi:hypothetical protein